MQVSSTCITLCGVPTFGRTTPTGVRRFPVHIGVHALELVQAYIHTHSTVDACEAELVRVLTKMEVMLPLCWNTNVRHVLLHLCEYIRRFGPFFTHNMLPFERWHIQFKRCVRSGHHTMSGTISLCLPLFSSLVNHTHITHTFIHK